MGLKLVENEYNCIKTSFQKCLQLLQTPGFKISFGNMDYYDGPFTTQFRLLTTPKEMTLKILW